jgi:S-adenosylmethionine synthetase
VGAQKKLSNGRRVAKLARRRSAETTKNSKNTETDKKVIQQNTKTKTEMEEAGDEEKGRGNRV